MARTHKRELAAGDLSKQTGNSPTQVVTSYVVPAGKTLRLQRFSGGWEYSTKEMRAELAWDGNVIAVGYACGSNFQLDINEDFVGDGVKALTITRVNGDNGAMHMASWWEGTQDE